MGAANIILSATVDSEQYTQNVTEPFGVLVKASESVPAAKKGVLTTRTNATTGSLTMDGGHGFTTAAIIDLFWYAADGSFGARRGVIVGTVATNVVPISGGTGDDLPIATTAITAMVPHVEVVSVVGDNVVLILAKSDYEGFVVFTEADDTVVLAVGIRSRTNNGYIWFASSNASNPLEGVTIGKIKTSHNDPLAAHAPVGLMAYN